jgi:SAM-dependent methyltransferase
MPAEQEKNREVSLSPLSVDGAFSRIDESDDALFYKKDRFVSHLDAKALETIEGLIGSLITESHPVILDLMAGWDSHIPASLTVKEVVGLGLNRNELDKNKALSSYVMHDLNADPRLPFPEGTFDVVINTVSVDYMTRPNEVFQEVGRVLKPGGLFLIIFSNRMFPQKAVKVWREASEEERVLLVEELFDGSGLFEKSNLFVSRGKPRPRNDLYARFNIPSDPVYAVYGDKKGGKTSKKPRPVFQTDYTLPGEMEGLEEKKKKIKETLSCPHCDERMKKWAVPDNPFIATWDNDFMYICFNDKCPYFVRGWDFMYKEGNRGVSYRLMYNPEKDRCMPIPVPTPGALRESIIEE